jgi:hypothetical protein
MLVGEFEEGGVLGSALGICVHDDLGDSFGSLRGKSSIGRMIATLLGCTPLMIEAGLFFLEV